MSAPMVFTGLWTLGSFLMGSVPFSVLIGRLITGKDIRGLGDGNPGAANAWRAGSWPVGVLALLLDYFKGALPVGCGHFILGIQGWGLGMVAIAPVVGHAFSPFLRFRGGKGLAVTFGVWTGLTLGEAPILLGLLLGLFYLVLNVEAWAVAVGMVLLMVHFVSGHAGVVVLAVAGVNTVLLLWTHRRDLRRKPGLRPWLRRRDKGR